VLVKFADGANSRVQRKRAVVARCELAAIFIAPLTARDLEIGCRRLRDTQTPQIASHGDKSLPRWRFGLVSRRE